MMNDLRDRPVFICGHPKSGTSLLRNLLDSHPQLVVYPEETAFFRRYLPEAGDASLEEKLSLAERHLIHIFEWNTQEPPSHQEGFPDRDYSAISFEEVAAALRQSASQAALRHAGDILSAAALAFGQVSGQLRPDTQRWVEKTPYNERYAERIFTWWPEALCVHLVRDPRDNYVSYTRKHRSWTAEFFAGNWVTSTRSGLANRERFGVERYLLVRYEDLALTPEEVLEKLRLFLGIEDHPTLRTPTRVGAPWGGNSMFLDRFNQISATPIGRWKNDLPLAEAAVIEMIAGAPMQALGYDLQGETPFQARLRAARWALRRKISMLLKQRERNSGQ